MPLQLPSRRWLSISVLAIVALGAFALSACGGGDDDGGGGNAASDEQYVRGVCDALASFQDELTKISDAEPNSVDDLQKLMNSLADAIENVADDLDNINPPADVADSHNAIVQLFRDAVEPLREGDLEALSALEPGNAFDPPADVQARLNAAAQNVEECQGLGVFE